ncbi:MAG: cytochrome c biogenesis protein CcdA [Bacteroidales bacterium]
MQTYKITFMFSPQRILMTRSNQLIPLFLFITLLFSFFRGYSQIHDPVSWRYEQEKISDEVIDLHFIAVIEQGWYLYAQDIPEGGPIPTSFDFEASDHYELIGETTEPEPAKKFDENFDMTLSTYSETATFKQRIKVLSGEDFQVKGELTFMCCDDERCLPPDYIPFTFAISLSDKKQGSDHKPAAADRQVSESGGDIPEGGEAVSGSTSGGDSARADQMQGADDQEGSVSEDEPTFYNSEDDEEESSLFWTFIMGLLGGLLALLTPCVFPMIPLTVSFFLKNANNRARAFRDAILYGLMIIFSYVVLGLAISLIFGPSTLNALATSPGFNIFFFALLVFFAASFFGAFELTLPASWSNSLDSKADKAGGIFGVLLMGLTFVLVSFSCTGPIVGTLLVEAAIDGSIFAPAVGMLGFSLALGIPFSLFAIFPTALNSLPKSGGWMNAVKVILGFIVLAFSLKFLSIADAVGQWGMLDREVFLVLWIAIFTLMSLYLIGKIKFAHDSEMKFLSVPRLILAIASFAFVFYLIPGLWGAPLKAISSFLPSPVTQDFNLSRTQTYTSPNPDESLYVGESVQEGPHGLMSFTDYEEGMEAAEKAGKPVFLHFTGRGCSNCRKMEANVWANPEVLESLRNDFVKISLFVDDPTELPEEKQFMSSAMGKERKIKTTGQKWSSMQAERYGANTQPYYVILDHDENMLAPHYGFDTDVENFIEFLETGKSNFRLNQSATENRNPEKQ